MRRIRLTSGLILLGFNLLRLLSFSKETGGEGRGGGAFRSPTFLAKCLLKPCLPFQILLAGQAPSAALGT